MYDKTTQKRARTMAIRAGLLISEPTKRGRSQPSATTKQATTIPLMEGEARNRDVSKAQKRRITAAHEALGSKLKTKRTKFANMGEASDYWRLTLAPALAKHGLSI